VEAPEGVEEGEEEDDDDDDEASPPRCEALGGAAPARRAIA
jgi:hypothetical protein